MLSFNDYIGKETLSKEYKEFSLFKKSLPLSIKQSEMYCESNMFDFNNDVMVNLKQYIKEYIPRYACGFWNAGIENGELIIGVNDFGLVKGIPYKGELDIDYLTSKIKKSIDTRVCTKENIRPNLLSLNITVELISVESPPLPTEKFHPEYTDYLLKKSAFIEKYNAFVARYDKWREEYDIINHKLVDIFNKKDTRQLLRNYISLHDEHNPVIGLIDSDFMLKQVTGNELKYLKMDTNNPYYWVTTYKDSMVEEYKKYKPVFTDVLSRSNTPYNLLISVGDMIPYWSNYNELNLYILRVVFTPNHNKDVFLYYNKETGWSGCKRTFEKDQPACIHF